MTDIKSYLKDKPDYIDILNEIVEYEENNPNPDHTFIEDTDYDTCWRNTEVGVHPSRLYQLEVNGILERVFDSNNTTSYVIKDRGEVKKILNQIEDEIGEEGQRRVMHEFPDEDKLPDNLFEDVVGYEDIKFLLKRGITTDKIVNFLLIGPSGSAKTVFLMSLSEKLSNAIMISQSSEATAPGFIDEMFKREPKYMLFDELDDMSTDDIKALSSYTETGILQETKYGKNRKMETNTKTFAAANETNPIPNNIINRFVDLYFEPYTRDEYIEVCENILPRKEGKDVEEARRIAERIWTKYQTGDVRRAIAVARLSRGDPEKIIDIIEDYSQEKLNKLGVSQV